MNTDCMQNVYIALGTNTGDREANLKQAIAKLTSVLGEPLAVSDVIETEPWGFESDNSFLNCAICFATELAPEKLLDEAERIEREMGRKCKSTDGKYHDRTIDIDILLYGNRVVNTPRLKVPHPLLHKRAFVLVPLAQIAPQMMHPVLCRTIKEILSLIK